MRRYTPIILLAGDVLALVLFVAIGQRDHDLVDPENPIGGLFMSAAVFIIPWVVVGWLAGAFGPLGDAGDGSHLPLVLRTKPVLARALYAWLVAAPLAILLRAVILGRAVIPTAFFAVAMGLGGVFVLGWRLLFLLGLWLLQRRALQRKTA